MGLSLLGPLAAASPTARGPMSSYPPKAAQPTFSVISHSFAYQPDAHFTGLLEPGFFANLADEHKVHFGQGANDTYNEAVSLWAWLTQALSRRKSCLAAVARVLVLCCSLSRPPCSANPGAYCKARGKLPPAFLKDATCKLGQAIEDRV